MSKSNKDKTLTIFLIIILFLLIFITFKPQIPFKIKEPLNVEYDKETNTINLNSLTLKQKIAQMVITWADDSQVENLQNMLIGGLYFTAKPTKQDFIDSINNFQNQAKIPFFITADLEGCVNPFENFKKFKSFKEIKTKEEAYQLGKEHGELLKELGFTIDFSPVVDLEDNIWNCRSFKGTPEEIAEKANNYIKGLNEKGIIATAKHYPGKTLASIDPHQYKTYSEINEDDLLPFKETIHQGVQAIMVSNLIVEGEVNSNNLPSVVSPKVITTLRKDFKNLTIADEITMLGLKNHYEDINQMYVDLFKVDHDLIIYIVASPKEVYEMIDTIENAVKKGEIKEKRIDDSVKRILNAKKIKILK